MNTKTMHARVRKIRDNLRLHFLLPAMLLASCLVHGFPPAPAHTIHGTVRDQVGNPLANGAEVTFESAAGVILKAAVASRIDSSINYELVIPMDAGILGGKYHPTALVPAAPFKLKVKVGKTTYVPMEMTGDLSKIGLPAGRTRMDLTLGVDADGNGLPDAWEKSVMAKLGLPWLSGQMKSSDQFPGTGMSFQEVYIAGTYSVAPKEGFALNIHSDNRGSPRLSFTCVKGRAYRVEACAVLGEWRGVAFEPQAPGAVGGPVTSFLATETRRMEVVVPTGGDETVRFYRLMVE